MKSGVKIKKRRRGSGTGKRRGKKDQIREDEEPKSEIRQQEQKREETK